jgi:hypothetical protein
MGGYGQANRTTRTTVSSKRGSATTSNNRSARTVAVNTSQLIINTITTIITFLLVALLQNSQTRSDQALQQKLNAIADDLRAAVGLENRESA